ncbi:MAG: DUF63 family protein [Candidatus Micrarchaeota archaeon]|nr:DUF63 family protein [Candidatus Micrarchaeota archaeon]
MEGFVQEYFVRPIAERSGYNLINTAVYAAIAMACVYLVWKVLKSRGFDFSSREFLYAAFSFILFGATARVLTDLSDSGKFSAFAAENPVYAAIDMAGIFHYGYLTVTPGIYVVTGILFFCSLWLSFAMRNAPFAAWAGMALWLPCLLLLLPFMEHFGYAFLALAIAAAGSLFAFAALSRFARLSLGIHQRLAIAGQALDGAATFVVIDLFGKQTGASYFEQHVLSAGIGTATPLGFFLFFLLKVALASLIVYFLSKERLSPSDSALVLIAVMVVGFGPGIRDLLRMLCGT